MRKANEDNVSSTCEGATASDFSETSISNNPDEEKKSKIHSNILEQEIAASNISDFVTSEPVEFSERSKSFISSTNIKSSKPHQTSDLIEPLEKIKLFVPQGSKELESFERSKLSEPSVSLKLHEASVKSKLSESSVRSKLSESSVRSKLSESSVRSKLSKSSVIFRQSEPSASSEQHHASVRSKFSEASVRSKLSDSSVRSKQSEPSVRAKFSEPSERGNTSKPSLKSKFTKLLVKSKILKPFAKYKLSSLETSESRKISKLSESREISQLPESCVESQLGELYNQSRLSEPPVQSHLSDLSVKSKPSKSSKSKFFEKSKQSESSPTTKLPVRKPNKALSKRLELRRSYMIALYEDMLKVKSFIDEVENFKPPYRERNVRHACGSNPREAAEWTNLHSYWDSLKEHITKLIVRLQVLYLDFDKRIALTIEEFQDIVEILIYVFIDIRELCEICQNGLDKYRKFCFYYNEYLFLVYASTFNSLVSSLREKLRVELNEFKIIEEKVLGLK